MSCASSADFSAYSGRMADESMPSALVNTSGVKKLPGLKAHKIAKQLANHIINKLFQLAVDFRVPS